MIETHASFRCFGATCAVHASDRTAPTERVEAVMARLLGWHDQFTRFAPTSELSQLNADPREAVEATADMRRFVEAARWVASASGGLVDPTLLHALEGQGYDADLRTSIPLPLALGLAPRRRAATPGPGHWRNIRLEGACVVRPRGLALDSGGVAKGLFADLCAEMLTGTHAFAIDCAGDLRIGGAPREVQVTSPFDGRVLQRLTVADGAVATSGIGRRSWMGADGRPAHHLLDPGTGRPAYTGVVQATALAPTALEAEMRAKAAVLSGPLAAEDWLVHGGVVVRDDASVLVRSDRGFLGRDLLAA